MVQKPMRCDDPNHRESYKSEETQLMPFCFFLHTLFLVVNPRRACARVTVVVLCVCLSVYPSVPALAASASVEDSKQRYSRVSLRLFLD